MPTTPSTPPSRCRPATSSAARLIVSTAAPRSPASTSCAISEPAARATSSRVTSAMVVGSPSTPASTRITSTPASRRRSRRNPYSAPLVSSVPIATTVAISALRDQGDVVALRGFRRAVQVSDPPAFRRRRLEPEPLERLVDADDVVLGPGRRADDVAGSHLVGPRADGDPRAPREDQPVLVAVVVVQVEPPVRLDPE